MMPMSTEDLMPQVRETADGWEIRTPGRRRNARLDLVIVQGADWSERITWVDDTQQPVDLSGYTAALVIKQTHTAATALVSLTQGAGIGLTATPPNIVLARTAAQTASLSFVRAVYGLELTTGGVVTRLCSGVVTLSKEVTA